MVRLEDIVAKYVKSHAGKYEGHNSFKTPRQVHLDSNMKTLYTLTDHAWKREDETNERYEDHVYKHRQNDTKTIWP